MIDDNDYDPHAFRIIAQPLTNREALVAILKSMLGTGGLAIPLAFAQSGWVLGIVSCVLIGIIMTYALHVLLKGMYETSKRHRIPDMTYSEAFSFAIMEGPASTQWLSKCSEIIVDVFLALYHFGIMAVYVLFMADNMVDIMRQYLGVLDSRVYMLALLLPLVLQYLIRDMKSLVPYAFAANIMLCVGYLIVFYYIFQNLPPLTDRPAVQELSRYPLFFGTLLFAMESVGLIVAIEANMATPKAYLGYTGVLNIGMFSVLVLYGSFGFFGYWKYGDEVKPSITLNVPGDDILPQIVKILFVVGIYLSYALQGYVVIDVVWNHYLARRYETTGYCWECTLRTFIVVLSVVVAIITSNLGIVISLVGAFCLSFLGFIAPGILDLAIRYKIGYGTCKIYLLQDIFLILFGIAGGGVGSWVAITELIEAQSNAAPMF